MSRICCLLCRLICSLGCRWCRWLLNVSFSLLAWFSLSSFLFIYLDYQFVTQMNNGWSRLLLRWHAKLIIVMCFLAKPSPLPSQVDKMKKWSEVYTNNGPKIQRYLFCLLINPLLFCTTSFFHPSISPLPVLFFLVSGIVVYFDDKQVPIKAHLVYWLAHQNVLYKWAPVCFKPELRRNARLSVPYKALSGKL